MISLTSSGGSPPSFPSARWVVRNVKRSSCSSCSCTSQWFTGPSRSWRPCARQLRLRFGGPRAPPAVFASATVGTLLEVLMEGQGGAGVGRRALAILCSSPRRARRRARAGLLWPPGPGSLSARPGALLLQDPSFRPTDAPADCSSSRPCDGRFQVRPTARSFPLPPARSRLGLPRRFGVQARLLAVWAPVSRRAAPCTRRPALAVLKAARAVAASLGLGGRTPPGARRCAPRPGQSSELRASGDALVPERSLLLAVRSLLGHTRRCGGGGGVLLAVALASILLRAARSRLQTFYSFARLALSPTQVQLLARLLKRRPGPGWPCLGSPSSLSRSSTPGVAISPPRGRSACTQSPLGSGSCGMYTGQPLGIGRTDPDAGGRAPAISRAARLRPGEDYGRVVHDLTMASPSHLYRSALDEHGAERPASALPVASRLRRQPHRVGEAPR